MKTRHYWGNAGVAVGLLQAFVISICLPVYAGIILLLSIIAGLTYESVCVWRHPGSVTVLWFILKVARDTLIMAVSLVVLILMAYVTARSLSRLREITANVVYRLRKRA